MNILDYLPHTVNMKKKLFLSIFCFCMIFTLIFGCGRFLDNKNSQNPYDYSENNTYSENYFDKNTEVIIVEDNKDSNDSQSGQPIFSGRKPKIKLYPSTVHPAVMPQPKI